MPTFIRHPKDFWAGIIFIFFGLAAVIIGQDYPMGTAGRMGPAYFPTILGAMLALIGAASVVRSMLRPGDAIGAFHMKNLLIILAAVALFGILMRGAGLVPAIVVLVLLSAYASPSFKLVPSLLIAGGLAAFSALLFVKVLGLPMPIFGPWLGG